MSHIIKSQLDDALAFDALDALVKMQLNHILNPHEHEALFDRVVLETNAVDYVRTDLTGPLGDQRPERMRVTAHEVSYWSKDGERCGASRSYVRRSFKPTHEYNQYYETDVLRVESLWLGPPGYRINSFFYEEGGGYHYDAQSGLTEFYTETRYITDWDSEIYKLDVHVRTEHTDGTVDHYGHYDGAAHTGPIPCGKCKSCWWIRERPGTTRTYCRHLVRTEWRDGTIEYYERGEHVRTQKPDGSVLVIAPDRDYSSEAAELREEAASHAWKAKAAYAYHEKQRTDCERRAEEAEAAAVRAEEAAAGVEEAAAGVEEAAAARAEEKPAARAALDEAADEEMPAAAAAASALSNNHVLLWLGCAELPGDDLLPLLCNDGQAGTHQRARFCTRHKVEDHSEGCGRRAHYRAAFTPTCQKCLFVRKYFGR